MNVLAVNELTEYLVELFESDPILTDLWIQGEVSNFTRSAAGHCYFTLKDSESQLRSVFFKHDARWSSFIPANGDAIQAHGRVTLYEPRGEYQLRVDLVQPAGVGPLGLAFEELRARLEREGLFDPGRKRPLPRMPRTIGVVTSGTGAVWHDIQTVIGRRFPLAELVLAPTRVQGEGAPEGIVAGIRVLCADPTVEVLIVGRGGGSAEDLWAFNDERVARAIFAARVPVISGVGHEVDVTIADFVADLRAPTPSAAAELCVPDCRELLGDVASARERLREILGDQLDDARADVLRARQTLARVSPANAIAGQRARLATLLRGAAQALRHEQALQRQRIGALERELAALNPRATLARGYALVEEGHDGRPLTSTATAQPGRELRVTVADGTFGVVVTTAGTPTPTRRTKRGTSRAGAAPEGGTER